MKPTLLRAQAHQLRDAVGHLTDGPRTPGHDVCLVVDGDRTLAPQDSGRLVGRRLGVDDAIRATFEALGYCSEAFSQVADHWATIPPARYLDVVGSAAAQVTVHDAWRTILAAVCDRTPVVVVTAGIPQVWRAVLDALGYREVTVIGGCHREIDAYVVCPETKRDLVTLLRRQGWKVVAAGDSPIDVEMLASADRALFVPDHKGSPGLRALLHRVPDARHLAVDARRYEGLAGCSAEAVVQMIRRGGTWDAA